MKRPGKFLLAGMWAASAVLSFAAQVTPAGEDQRFGVMTHFAQGWDPSWIPLIVQGGLPEVRDELYWQEVEAQKGKFVFPDRFERYMAELNQNHVSPLIVLDFENTNYDNGLTPYTDDGIEAYARYAVQVLRHYGKQVKAVEIWNEYNGTFCKGPAAHDRAGTYLLMLRTAYAAIKQERPDVIVAGGGTSGIPLPYWEELMAGGGLAFMDVLSVHPYRYDSPPEGLETDIAALQDLVKKYNGGKSKPVWVTEIGWGTKPSTAVGDLAIDDDVLAKFLVRAYALLLSADVQRIYWYLFRDYQQFNMGLVRDDAKRTPKPAYVAMAAMIQQLHGANFVTREKTPEDIYSLVFARPSGGQVRVLWSLKPVSVAASGVTKAVDIKGKPIEITSQLYLDDSPIFVTGPLQGLPAPPASKEIILADSLRNFSSAQGNPWSYGVFMGGSTTFIPLPNYVITDWVKTWAGQYPYISLTASDQHPSAVGSTPVSAVRRWKSNYAGPVRIAGHFRCGTQGDGVGVSILVDGQRRFRKLLGGGNGNPVVESFDFVQSVRPGTLIDFAVDPGPGVDINFDATTVYVTISRLLKNPAVAFQQPASKEAR
jgi:hypothetical protein